tara:strand:+ start:2021 stop:3223 length:1203 start_codon:yes stop_codon:yes gene_type:complete
MFRPYIKRTGILILIATINLLLVYISYISFEFAPSYNYDMKIRAANIMEEALEITKDYSKNLINNSEQLLYDRFNSGLIGVDSTFSSITTKEGSLYSKVAVTNPNFSALFIQLFSEIDSSLINPNIVDTIAVSYTGSFPGANIALLSACKAANIYPIIISSIGSSSWGANQIEMTWADIEDHLSNNIFEYRSSAFSLGGDQDRMDELSDNIKELLKTKILKNNYNLIESSLLSESIDKRMDIYNSKSKNYKAYVSIGGSAASLGDSTTTRMFLPGLNFEKDSDIEEAINNAFDEDLIDKDIDDIIPVIQKFVEEVNIPVINIRNINNLCDWYDLPYSDDSYNSMNMEIGFGELFGVRTPHHRLVVWSCLIISLLTLIWIVLSSISQVNKKMEEIHNEPVE